MMNITTLRFATIIIHPGENFSSFVGFGCIEQTFLNELSRTFLLNQTSLLMSLLSMAR
jgi:hypothetical protein